jgi:hypothetical protein
VPHTAGTVGQLAAKSEQRIGKGCRNRLTYQNDEVWLLARSGWHILPIEEVHRDLVDTG